MKTMTIRLEIEGQFLQVAREQEIALPALTDDLELLSSGLDSLCLAILVTRLEEKLGVDPFSADDVYFPITFGEFVSSYETAAAR